MAAIVPLGRGEQQAPGGSSVESMTDRVHVKAELELFVDDADALRKSAFERLRSAWKGDDEFPYDSPGDVPLEEVVASVLGDALPIGLPGAKRSALSVEAESLDSDEDQDDKKQDESDDDSDDEKQGDSGEDSGGDSDEDQSDAQQDDKKDDEKDEDEKR
jgi:hypothetical protein